MKNIALLVAFLVCCSSAVFSQAVVPDAVYRQADAAMSEAGAPELPVILSVNSSKAWMPRLEAYVLKKARQLVIENNLEQASALSLHIIDNNLDNIQALELYQSIRTAMVKQEAENKKAAERQALESHRQQVAESKIKQDLSKTYKTVNTTSGKKIYLDQDFNSHYRTITWEALLGLGNVSWGLDDGESSVKYGLSGAASVFYRGESWIVGMDAEGHGMILSFMGTPSVNWGAEAVGVFSSAVLNKYLGLRLGYSFMGIEYGEQELPAFSFQTPVVGLGLHDVKLGETGRLKMGIDYYAGHLFADTIDAALGFNLTATSVMAELSDFDIHFRTGIRDTLMIKGGTPVNDVRLILAFGVGNYE